MSIAVKKILPAVLIFGFVVRIIGIGYGLPLWLVSDEPPFVLASLKMIELKTVIPSFHSEDFSQFLYYPPYISYLYLPFFLSILAFKYFSFDGDQISFINYLGADLSDFFIAARFLNVLLSILSIYLAYKVAKNIFKEDWVSLASAFFLATSILHITLSIVARQWLAVSLIFLLVIYFLTTTTYSFKKRYFLAVLTSGIGMGVSVISSVSLLFIALYFIFFEGRKFYELIREKFVYLTSLMLIFLALAPMVLYSSSVGFRKDLFEPDPNFFTFFKPLFLAEPILTVFFIAGLISMVLLHRKLFWFVSIFLSAYYLVFYFIFRFEDRFLVPLLPIISIVAGLGVKKLFDYFYMRKKILAVLLFGLVVIPLARFSIRFGYLAYVGDSRENIVDWIGDNVPEGSKIIVNARLTRISSNREALVMQEKMDPNSLRWVDRTEAYFKKSPIYPSFHALNLNSVDNIYLQDIEKYAKDNRYEYLVLSDEDFRKDDGLHRKFMKMAQSGELIASFGEDSGFSVSESKLGGNPFTLFETRMLGPGVSLYKLR